MKALALVALVAVSCTTAPTYEETIAASDRRWQEFDARQEEKMAERERRIEADLQAERDREWTRVGKAFGEPPGDEHFQAAARQIQSSLKNPPSFELVGVSVPAHVEARTESGRLRIGWGYVVTYRATNGFGGVVTETQGFVRCSVADESGSDSYWARPQSFRPTTPGK